jgi:glycosyltransferase involved in cell wall biosynthesis
MEVAGAEQVVLALARGLDRRRFQPIVGCLTVEGPLAVELRAAGLEVFALGKRPGPDALVLLRLARSMRAGKIDVVHTHVWNADVWGRLAGWVAGVPVLLTTAHNVDSWKKRRHLAVDRALAAVSRRLVCVSEAVRTFYRERAGIPEAKLTVIRNGIDPSPFDAASDAAPARARLGLNGSAPVLTVVARLVPQKGHRYFLEALVSLRREFPAALGLVVGDGALRGELEALASQLGLLDGGGVRFLGERRDVPEILSATDVFVLPSSLREGLPISLLEAMAARRAVVVTDIGGNRETVEDGVSGRVVPPADAQALAQACAEVLRDPSLAASLGRAARAKVEREFSVARMVRQTEELYDTVLEEAFR